jgi:hypothetical protein
MDRAEVNVPGCRRETRRESVQLAASAYAFARSNSVIVCDLSASGAQLSGNDLPPPEADLFMIVGSFDTMARVAWREGPKCGVEFEERVGEEVIGRMKQEAQWSSVAGWYR